MRYIVTIMLLFVSSMTYSSHKEPEGRPQGKAPGELTIVAMLQPATTHKEKAPGEHVDHGMLPPGKAPGEYQDHLQRRGSGGDCGTDPPPKPYTVSPQHRPSVQPGGDCPTKPPKGKVSPQPQRTGVDGLGVALDQLRVDKNISPPVVAGADRPGTYA